MFRFLARLLGLLLVAGGFVVLVVDGTRIIANGRLMLTAVGEVLAAVAPRAAPALEAWARALEPRLWDPALIALLSLPAALAGFALGVALLWLGRKPVEPIGYLARR